MTMVLIVLLAFIMYHYNIYHNIYYQENNVKKRAEEKPQKIKDNDAKKAKKEEMRYNESVNAIASAPPPNLIAEASCCPPHNYNLGSNNAFVKKCPKCFMDYSYFNKEIKFKVCGHSVCNSCLTTVGLHSPVEIGLDGAVKIQCAVCKKYELKRELMQTIILTNNNSKKSCMR